MSDNLVLGPSEIEYDSQQKNLLEDAESLGQGTKNAL